MGVRFPLSPYFRHIHKINIVYFLVKRMKVLLDTNFIVSCIKDRIDFLGQLEEEGFQAVVPQEVFEELKDIKKKVSHDSRIAIDVAFEMFEQRKVKKMKLGEKSVDLGLIKRGQEGYYIATLDSGILNKVPKRVILLKGKKGIGIENG